MKMAAFARGKLTAAAAALAVSLAGSVALAQSNITADVMQRGVLRIGTAAGNAPYSSINPSGEPEGYDVEIAKAFAASLKLTPEFTIVDSPGRITALQTGKVDIVVANFTYTPERSTAVAFTEPYLVVGVSFIVPKDSPIQSVEELNAAGKKISSPRGSTSAQVAADVAPQAETVLFENVNDALLAMKSGQADAQATENLAVAAWMAKDPDIRLLPGVFSYEEIAIGVPSGNFDWWRIVNSWVYQFNHSGANAALFKKTIGFDMPPLQ
jgi:polar amino acid transport system substrate-binding protein